MLIRAILPRMLLRVPVRSHDVDQVGRTLSVSVEAVLTIFACLVIPVMAAVERSWLSACVLTSGDALPTHDLIAWGMLRIAQMVQVVELALDLSVGRLSHIPSATAALTPLIGGLIAKERRLGLIVLGLNREPALLVCKRHRLWQR